MDRIELEQADFHNEVYKGYRDLEKNHPDRIKGDRCNQGYRRDIFRNQSIYRCAFGKGQGTE